MDTLLLSTPTSFNKTAKGNAIPLGLAYLTSQLLNHGVSTLAVDLDVTPLDENELNALIRASSPRLIGIGCTTPTRFVAFELIEKIKREFPEIHVTIGGHHASSAIEDTWQNTKVDSIVVGEGELTLLELCQKLIDSGQDLNGVDGLVYKCGNSTIYNKPRELISDLDSLPFPERDMFASSAYGLKFPLVIEPQPKRVEYLITTRGCPFKCRFCSASVAWQGKIRYRKPDKVVDEIEYLVKKRKCDGLYIYDDFFTASEKHITGIHDEMINRRISLPIYCYSRVDSVNYSKFKKLAEIGVKVVSFGMESGSQKILDYYEKGALVEQAVEAVKICKELGIYAKGTFITGIPQETVFDFWKTLMLIDRIRDIQPNFSGNLGGIQGAIIFPGTGIHKDAVEGRVLPEDFKWTTHYNYLPSLNNTPLYQNKKLIALAPYIVRFWRVLHKLKRIRL